MVIEKMSCASASSANSETSNPWGTVRPRSSADADVAPAQQASAAMKIANLDEGIEKPGGRAAERRVSLMLATATTLNNRAHTTLGDLAKRIGSFDAREQVFGLF